jgi:hypothetical protein
VIDQPTLAATLEAFFAEGINTASDRVVLAALTEIDRVHQVKPRDWQWRVERFPMRVRLAAVGLAVVLVVGAGTLWVLRPNPSTLGTTSPLPTLASSPSQMPTVTPQASTTGSVPPTATPDASPAPTTTQPASQLPASPTSSAPGRWSPTGSMSQARFGAAATLLHDGRVLVAGGYGNASESQELRTAEIYDPVSGAWTTTAQTAKGMVDGRAITLLDGRVLLVGDESAQIYDPRADEWRKTGAFHYSDQLNESKAGGLTGHAAALLGDGRVLVVGGAYPAAEVFDPTTMAWAPLAVMTNHGMGVTAVSLADGRVLVAGGQQIHGHVGGSDVVETRAAELLNPTDLSWTRVGSMQVAQYYAASAVLTSGQVLVASGRFGNGPGSITSAELFDPSTDLWSSTGDMPDAVHGGSAVTLPDGRVLVNAPPPELYDPSKGTWVRAPSMLQPRYASISVLLSNGAVLVAGGTLASDGTPTSSAELYQP